VAILRPAQTVSLSKCQQQHPIQILNNFRYFFINSSIGYKSCKLSTTIFEVPWKLPPLPQY